jgi:two-component system cell cycle sensor histidine kinase/response regulator CckA
MLAQETNAMLGSLDEAIGFARTADGESVQIFVVDWHELTVRFDQDGLWDERRLDDWLRATSNPATVLAPLLRVRYASEALVRAHELADFEAFNLHYRHALLALGYPDGAALRAFCRGDCRTLEAPAVFAATGTRSIALHRPRRTAAFAVTLHLIVERSAAEQELRRSEARYRGIVEDQTDFIVRYRADGVRTFVNNAYADFFGGKPEDFVGKSFLSLVTPEHREAVVEKIRRLVERESEVLADEHLSIRRDGVECWTHWIDRAIFDERGNFLELQAVGRDLTERKDAEQRLAQAQKMEALGTMAGGLAHDFNNTLSAILGLAELIVHRPEDRLRVMRCAEEILEATERASELTRSLLYLSRRPPRRLGQCDVREIIEAAGRLLRVTIPGRITLKLDTPELPRLQADGGQLTQALINLGLNARDAIIDRGTISIAAELVARGGGETIILRVTDDGAGIPEHVRSHLFEPFFTTKPEGQGTGLGLAMVYACAMAHGGRVECTSEIGRGSTFEIHLPLPPIATQSEPAPARVPGGGQTILLVDDDPLVRLHSRMILEHGGYTVVSASSKDEALECHRELSGEIAAVVTDLVMPNGNGRELEQALHAERPDLPIVLITGGLAEHGRGEFAAVLEKPVNADELLRSLASVLIR